MSDIIEPAEEKDNEGRTSLPSPPRGRSPDHLDGNTTIAGYGLSVWGWVRYYFIEYKPTTY